jgi:hypothetical protein
MLVWIKKADKGLAFCVGVAIEHTDTQRKVIVRLQAVVL